MAEEVSPDESSVEILHSQLTRESPSTKRRAFEKFILAALGSIPWVGGFASAAATFKFEESTVRQDTLQSQWLEEHQKKIENLMAAISQITGRFENFGDEVEERIQSDEYLDLVRKAFRAWDHSDTDEKRQYIGNLIANAAGTRLCSDDVLRLFIDWLEKYHEAHLAVIRTIYQNPGCTRYDIWANVYGAFPREDSAEADLFRLLIFDLNTGRVIRQARETNEIGQFIRSRPAQRTPRSTSGIVESSFEDTKPYVLTELGQQFVHYTMNEVVPRIEPKG